MSFLNENNVDLSDLKKAPAEDENEWGRRLQSPPSEPDLIERNIYSQSQLEEAQLPSNTSNDLDLKSACEPKQKRFNDRTIAEVENSCEASNHSHETIENSRAGSSLYKRRFGFHSPNLFIQQDDVVKEILPKEEILLRFYNKEGMKSYQLGEQLSFKWTTGAGPRIGCVRDCPYELQFRALEQVNLSPRGSESSRPFSSSMVIRSPRSKMQESSTLHKSLLQNLIARDRI
ncbi:hypothetical protein MA16_Dca003508 [Dendrobium catenatum]|uniref:Uncharacterized protein n=2 Tax=Dendrobium catenatum TaxID=906689 RepID=A0A2I0WF71_9ASPA|nr:hypothetical protein MA16_Dca003508 [Dendrobium catenatum]